MAITVKHNKVSTIPDTDDTSLVRPSDWNADHTLVGTIDVANGGTGASTLTGYVKGNGTSAMTAVATVPSTDITGLGTMSTQNANAVAITGGTINNTTIGATTASTGRFSDLTDTGLTSGRVVYASTGGNLVDASNFTYDGTNLVAGAIQNTPIGATTANTGKFTTLESTGNATLGTGSSQYIQAAGGSTEAQLSAQGAGTNIPLALQPKGTGALQAQATTSTTAGGNARGANSTDFQTTRNAASQVASGTAAFLGSGFAGAASGAYAALVGGIGGSSTGFGSFVGCGNSVISSGTGSVAVGGQNNTGSGYFSFVGSGQLNSTTSNSAVTTQSATMNATTAVTLSGSNANIKVGQLITGTSIASYTYVAAISGTSLTLSQAASGSSTSTLSFFTPHGVVVGGGNNQATGSYSFIGGGGDAGTAANRNVASGLYGTVVGGRGNTASGIGSFVGGGGVFLDTVTNIYPNTASGGGSAILGGLSNTASGSYSTVLGGLSNTANAAGSVALGQLATTRSIVGNLSFSSCEGAVAFAFGVSQTSILTLGRQTTDATPTALTSTTAGAGTTNQVILPNNSAYFFKGSVIANVTGAANGAAWSFEGAIMRGANAASTVLIDTPSVNRVAASSGATAWTIALTADTTNGGLTVTVTGVASTTIRWVAKVETTEVTF